MKNLFFDIAIAEAERAFNEGNFPVGAVLVIGKTLLRSRNIAEKTKNYSQHAETRLILDNATKTLKAWRNNEEIVLYSTLEPCLMCLGIAVMNKINKIYYIQEDPLAGACGLDVSNLGKRYSNVFPMISKVKYSNRPKDLLIKFLKKQISNGVRVDWSNEFLNLLGVTNG